jgi:hypothetical protein
MFIKIIGRIDVSTTSGTSFDSRQFIIGQKKNLKQTYFQ